MDMGTSFLATVGVLHLACRPTTQSHGFILKVETVKMRNTTQYGKRVTAETLPRKAPIFGRSDSIG
jgi:hypothetical protein